MTSDTILSSQQKASQATAKKLPAILAMTFGLFILMGVGFSHIDAVHNVAHDVRHAFAFPCH